MGNEQHKELRKLLSEINQRIGKAERLLVDARADDVLLRASAVLKDLRESMMIVEAHLCNDKAGR